MAQSAELQFWKENPPSTSLVFGDFYDPPLTNLVELLFWKEAPSGTSLVFGEYYDPSITHSGSTFSGTFPTLSVALNAGVRNAASFSGTFPALSVVLHAGVENRASFSGTFPNLTVTELRGDIVREMDFSGKIPELYVNFTVAVQPRLNEATFSGTFPNLRTMATATSGGRSPHLVYQRRKPSTADLVYDDHDDPVSLLGSYDKDAVYLFNFMPLLLS